MQSDAFIFASHNIGRDCYKKRNENIVGFKRVCLPTRILCTQFSLLVSNVTNTMHQIFSVLDFYIAFS